MSNLALFDLDQTLLPIDSDAEWMKYMIRHHLIDEPKDFIIQAKKFHAQYLAGCLDIHSYVKFSIAPITKFNRIELDRHHKNFMQESILPKMDNAIVQQIITSHQANGDLCCIITATNTFIAKPIAKAFNIDYVLAVEIETDANGKFLPKIKGTPTFQKGKILRLEQWLTSLGYNLHSFPASYFYSDSHNDIPLLTKVTHPIAVNPDAILYQHAQNHGWQILDPFKNQ